MKQAPAAITAPAPSASPPPVASPPLAASAADPAPPVSAADPALIDRLASGAVYDERCARRVLYTWTTAAQVTELARSPTLLTRTESAKNGRAFFDRRRDQSRSQVSRLFDEPALAKRRFAWANPWATLRGWEGESYGDRLIRVTLKDQAIIAVFNPDDKNGMEWRFFTLDGAEVQFDSVIRQPERIAAVYHVFEGIEGGDHEAQPYREYVLCNESMIASWEIGTQRIHDEVARDLDLLRRVRADLDRAPPERRPGAWPFFVARSVWPKKGDDPRSTTALYEANLAFANDRYKLDPAVLDEVIKAVAAVPPGDALEHAPNAAFPGFDPSFKGGLPTQTAAGNRLTKCFPRGTFGCQPLAGPPGKVVPAPPKVVPPRPPPPVTGKCRRVGTFLRCPPGVKP